MNYCLRTMLSIIMVTSSHQSFAELTKDENALLTQSFDTTNSGTISRSFDYNNTTTATRARGQAEWTIMMMVEARNNLAAFASKNLQDIASLVSNERVNVIVQWHQAQQKGIWRYRIHDHKISVEAADAGAQDQDPSTNLTSFVEWGVQQFPADKYFLVLWDHGTGICDPLWGKNPFRIILNDLELRQNPRLNIEGITEVISEHDQEALLIDLIAEQRGILFDETNRAYMNNQDLSKALAYCTTNILKKPFDVIGMDACFMAMVEVSYQIRKYARYFVASQEVELAQGWNYPDLFTDFLAHSYSPAQAVSKVVESYETYYKGKTHLYTQSAIELAQMDSLKQSIDQVSDCMKVCVEQYGHQMRQAIKKARNNSLQFSSPSYVDLHSFYTALSKELDENIKPVTPSVPDNIKNRKKAQKAALPPTTLSSQPIINLKAAIAASLAAHNRIIIANTSSTHLGRAKGLSIYFPRYTVDQSYLKTDFALESSWTRFLTETLG